MFAQTFATKNDTNGNGRRVTIVFSTTDGRDIATIRHTVDGVQAVRDVFPTGVELAWQTIEIPPREYHRLLRRAKFTETLHEYH